MSGSTIIDSVIFSLNDIVLMVGDNGKWSSNPYTTIYLA